MTRLAAQIDLAAAHEPHQAGGDREPQPGAADSRRVLELRVGLEDGRMLGGRYARPGVRDAEDEATTFVR